MDGYKTVGDRLGGRRVGLFVKGMNVAVCQRRRRSDAR